MTVYPPKCEECGLHGPFHLDSCTIGKVSLPDPVPPLQNCGNCVYSQKAQGARFEYDDKLRCQRFPPQNVHYIPARITSGEDCTIEQWAWPLVAPDCCCGEWRQRT